MRLPNELVLFWKRRDGLRCVALKHPAGAVKARLWEVRVVRSSRIIKAERFDNFRAAMHAARMWRVDFVAT